MLLDDPLLNLLAANVDDLETVRIAGENRLRQLTRTEEDSDGLTRGFGLPEDDPLVDAVSLSVEALKQNEANAIKRLEKHVRTGPWGPFVKRSGGVGEKQIARLLASIGDPYWNSLHERPRTVSELWAYCGFHVIGGQAPGKRKGQRCNWSQEARKRAWLIATSCVKAKGHYRDVYDETRAKYAEAVHSAPCVRCGPSGKPASEGSPLSNGHQHARALRAVAKELLRDMWSEAKEKNDAEDL